MNITDKEYLSKKDKLFLSVLDSDKTELYSSKETPFSEIVKSFPYQFSFKINTNYKEDKCRFEIRLMDGNGIEAIFVGQIGETFSFENKQNYLNISDKYNLNLSKKNYFSVSKNKSSGNNISFFLKVTVENVLESLENEEQGYQEKEEEQEQEQNWDNI